MKLDYNLTSDLIWRIVLTLASVTLILSISDIALASGTGASSASNDVVGITLCRLVQNLSGGLAKGIATIAIFSVGVGLFLGKLNWSIAAATAVGVGVIFSAPKLVAFISGDSNNSTCPTA